MVDPNYLLWSISENDNEDDFRLLFEHYYAALCLYARRYIEDRDTREDIVQDVFLHIWSKRKSISTNSSAINYLITCVKNASLNHLRRQSLFLKYQNKTIEKTPVYSRGEDELYTLKELEEILAEALLKLPTEYRMAFEMSKIKSMKTEDIAVIMNISTRTVERYKSKAIEILKIELKDFLPLLFFLLI